MKVDYFKINFSGETFQSEAVHGKYVPFEHPFDINLSTKSVRGWPKLLVEVWEIDLNGRNSIAGYGLITIPFEAGEYSLDIGNYLKKNVYSSMLETIGFIF